MRMLLGLVLVPAVAAGAVDFHTHVRPILERSCYPCHGPKAQMHGLRLDSRAAAEKGGESGVSALHLIYRYISGQDKDIKMPPGKLLPADDIAAIKQWLDDGAHYSGEAVASAAPEDEKFVRGRKHWAFQPRAVAIPPHVKRPAWARNPIDAFVLAKLEAKGWTPSPQAEPRDLLRRVYFDLTGLPPTIAEQNAFLSAPTPAALDKLIGELMERPAYAERWARHWLDVVRYAESNGYERDGVKPNAWKYRDYVIHAFAEDKPFNRFLTEQIAGDELDDVSADTLIATGFHRLGPWDDEPADPATDRFDQLDDVISTTSQAFLGLTIGCARCHNHKFEPLTAADYYSMVAIFRGLERPRSGRTELDLPVGTRAELDRETARDAEMAPFRKQIGKLEAPYRAKGKGWQEQVPAEVKEQIAELRAKIEAYRRATPDLPRGYFLHERKAPELSHILLRGKPGALGPEVQPAVPAILVKQQPPFTASSRTSGRRLSFARWLASPENPLTARVIVNRVWMWHFGEGLVRTPSDFGLMGQKPTHPELLDWLATRFVEEGWSLKKLHRLILTSNTWRMSKALRPDYQAADPENRLLWRMPYKRLEVEAIRDSVLAVSGKLNAKMHGPSVFPPIPPQALEGSSDPDKIWKPSSAEDAARRSIYVFPKRSLIVPMFDALDLCDTARSAAQRMTTTVPTQALTLFNGDFVNEQARYLAGRLHREAPDSEEARITLAYRLVLARKPTSEEMGAMRSFLAKDPSRGLEQIARVMFNLNEFVYVD
ncbi:MAG: PSD1 domain-containing protein [Acidobacteria bacterium]|nr:PSD1 domain-containing protein [Acidobacteriota bacterium]